MILRPRWSLPIDYALGAQFLSGVGLSKDQERAMVLHGWPAAAGDGRERAA
jgi:hypothetical protein